MHRNAKTVNESIALVNAWVKDARDSRRRRNVPMPSAQGYYKARREYKAGTVGYKAFVQAAADAVFMPDDKVIL